MSATTGTPTLPATGAASATPWVEMLTARQANCRGSPRAFTLLASE